jgi:hypothetical protein
MSRNRRIAIGAVCMGLIVCGAVVAFDPAAFFLGYLVVAVAFGAIPAGALAVLLMSYLVRGDWTQDLHPALVSSALTAPLAGVMFMPVLAGLPWLHDGIATTGDAGSFKSIYLAPGFFAVRTIAIFAAWSGLAIWAYRAWGDSVRMRVCASTGLIVYALTASVAGIDWLQSLSAGFHSSIYGLLFMTFQVMAGYAFALAVRLLSPRAETHRYGAIFLAAILLWGYNHAMQYIIIWSGNIPEEAAWYAERERGVWEVALWALIGLQFIVPFFVLLSEQARQSRRVLLVLALMTVGLRLLESAVLALPGRDGGTGAVLAAILGGSLLSLAIWGTGFVVVRRHVDADTRGRRALTQAVAGSHAQAR